MGRSEEWVLPLFGRTIFMRINGQFSFNGMNYMFIGPVKRVEEVPNIHCLYIYNGGIYMRTPTRNVENVARLIAMTPKPTGTPRTVTPGDSQLLKLVIHPEDDELMVRCKKLLIDNKVTVGMFKEMYGEDNKVDMNNDKSRLESKDKHTLSYPKFKLITTLLGYTHHIELVKGAHS